MHMSQPLVHLWSIPCAPLGHGEALGSGSRPSPLPHARVGCIPHSDRSPRERFGLGIRRGVSSLQMRWVHDPGVGCFGFRISSATPWPNESVQKPYGLAWSGAVKW